MFMQRIHYMYVDAEAEPFSVKANVYERSSIVKPSSVVNDKFDDDEEPVAKEIVKPEHSVFNVMIVFALICVFVVNNTIFINSSIFMYTINLFLETICFLYMAKYFEYEGLQKIAMLMQLAFFHLSHQLIKNVLGCFGADTEEYVNLSMPEVKR